MAELVPLRAGDLALDIAPAVGAAITAFSWGPDEILRETPPTAIGEHAVRQTSCFALIPYCNRIAGARFTFGGESFELARNFGDHPHYIHGNGWQREWRVESAEPSEAVLTLDHDPARDGARQWPFAYRARQGFVLESDALVVSLAVENRDRRAMPAGIGLHPYFIERPGATLRFAARDVWRTDETSIPTERTPVPPEWDFAPGRAVTETGFVDNCFNGWNGEAEITYERENVRVRIQADPVFGHLVAYKPQGRGFFAAEPVSNMPDAVHRLDVADNGLVTLQPGERLQGTVRFQVETVR